MEVTHPNWVSRLRHSRIKCAWVDPYRYNGNPSLSVCYNTIFQNCKLDEWFPNEWSCGWPTETVHCCGAPPHEKNSSKAAAAMCKYFSANLSKLLLSNRITWRKCLKKLKNLGGVECHAPPLRVSSTHTLTSSSQIPWNSLKVTKPS